MTATVIQGAFLGGQPRLASVQPRLAPPPVWVPLPIQAKSAVRPSATAFAGPPPGPPSPAFQARPPGPPAPAFAGRPGAVQRQGAGGAFAVEAGALGLAAGAGRPLPDALRGKMEAALGADFSGVRVHVGPQAERIGAIAFTLGSDIYFAPGRYQPETIHGQQLLGHELAHVVQQRAGRVRNPLGTGLAVVQDHGLEAEADRLGQRAAMHRGTAQAKMPPGAAQPSAPVRVSPPVAAGPGRYRLTAGTGGRPVGSVTVHAREKGAIEVTDLNVTEAHRGHGVGQMLVASAAKTGRQLGKSTLTLAAQDNGTGHLTQWYKGMGFAQVGVNHRSYPQLEAPISRVLAGVAQRREIRSVGAHPHQVFGAVAGVAQRRMLVPLPPSGWTGQQPNSRRVLRFAQVVQRMEEVKTTAGHAEDFVVLKSGYWLVKKVDKFEASEYEKWKSGKKPEVVPDFYGPFVDFHELYTTMSVKRIIYSSNEFLKIHNMAQSLGSGDKLLLLSNIGQGSGRRPIDLKLGIHTASSTDQERRGESGPLLYFKIGRHNLMDWFGPSNELGVRDEGAHKSGKMWSGSNLEALKHTFNQSPLQALEQIKADLEAARKWVNTNSIVYVGSSVLIDIDKIGRTGRARMIDFAHPIYSSDGSFSTYQEGIVRGLSTVIGLLDQEIEIKRIQKSKVETEQKEWEEWEKQNPSLIGNWPSLETAEYNPYLFSNFPNPHQPQHPPRLNLPDVLPGLRGPVATFKKCKHCHYLNNHNERSCQHCHQPL